MGPPGPGRAICGCSCGPCPDASSPSPADARAFPTQRAASSLDTIAEEPAPGPGPPPLWAAPPSPPAGEPRGSTGPGAKAQSPHRAAPGAPVPLQPRARGHGDTEPALQSGQQAWNGGGPGGACEGAPGSWADSRAQPRLLGHRPLVRRVNSEGQVPSEPLSARRPVAGPAPAVRSDATNGDQLWQRLEPGSHGDGVSSSSSLSSSDTVVDLSLPGLDALAGVPAARMPLRPRSATAARLDFLSVTKSKSNPNLWAAGQFPAAPGELRPQPSAPRPPWGCLPLAGLRDCPASAKSKSLGDLTADDFVPRDESLGRSLGRGLGPAGEGPGAQGPRQDALTEQLRWLTGFQQAGDITSPTSLGPAGAGTAGGPPFQRRSSRSQSRVRAIASRARRAQECQQRLLSPEEERGAPEGACSMGQEGFGGPLAPRSAMGLPLRL